MALRDNWHRALVYFGLAEDDRYADEDEQYVDDDVEPEAELEERYRDRSQVRRVTSRRRDEIDDIFADEPQSKSRTRVLRSVGNGRAGGGGGDNVRVHLTGPINAAADITPAALAELDLAPGRNVWAAVKATETHAYPA